MPVAVERSLAVHDWQTFSVRADIVAHRADPERAKGIAPPVIEPQFRPAAQGGRQILAHAVFRIEKDQPRSKGDQQPPLSVRQ